MLEGIERSRTVHQFDLWAYVVMPEHVHLLIWPKLAEYSISNILKTMKQSVSRKALMFVRQQALKFLIQMEDKQPNGKVSYRFWQRGGGYDRNLTEPKTIWQTMDYIHANPVRRQLCQHAIDWPWSSAVEWEHPGTSLLSLDQKSVPRTTAD